MKYFKITNLTTKETHYVSSTLPRETSSHVAISCHLNPAYKYNIEEVSGREFCLASRVQARDVDCEGDWDWEDRDNFYE